MAQSDTRGAGSSKAPPFLYVPAVYKMTKVLEDGREVGKNQFSIEIIVCKFYNVLKLFKFQLVFRPNAQRFASRFL